LEAIVAIVIDYLAPEVGASGAQGAEQGWEGPLVSGHAASTAVNPIIPLITTNCLETTQREYEPILGTAWYIWKQFFVIVIDYLEPQVGGSGAHGREQGREGPSVSGHAASKAAIQSIILNVNNRSS
jgi:hypothetical protein